MSRVRAPYRLALLVVLAFVLGACSGTDADRGADEPGAGQESGAQKYVALGDSAASGMGIPPEQLGDLCRRSARSYPVLLSERRGLELDNRTCAGARIEDLLGAADAEPDDEGTGAAETDAEPQIAALDEQTALVTVMAGANDLGYAALVSAECAAGRKLASCSTAEARGEVELRLRAVAGQLRRLLEEIKTRAPQARVLVVGYGDALGKSGPCKAMPLTEGAYELAVSTVHELNAVLRAATERAGVEFVDAHSATRGHGVCDPEPWTNGFKTDGDGAIGHPRSGYHAAIVDLLDDRLG